jgi:hypothetical protein
MGTGGSFPRSKASGAQREGRRDVEGGEEVGRGQKSLEKLRGSPLLLNRRQQEMMMMMMKAAAI